MGKLNMKDWIGQTILNKKGHFHSYHDTSGHRAYRKDGS